MTRRALVTGVTGQDGSYLAEQLLADGVEVYGLVRNGRAYRRNYVSGVRYVMGDILDPGSLKNAFLLAGPHEIYNLAAATSPGTSWLQEQPKNMFETTGVGTLNMLEALRLYAPEAHLVQAGSSAIFSADRKMQNELSPRKPELLYGLYGASKLFAYEVARGYRDGHGLRVSTAILYSHTSPRQSDTFLAKRITRRVAEIACGREDNITLGNVHAARDWGYAPDYVGAMRLMAQQTLASDYIVATGRAHTVKDFVTTAFNVVGRDSLDHVRISAELFHSFDRTMIGDATKARSELNWIPSMSFEGMIAEMVHADIARLK